MSTPDQLPLSSIKTTQPFSLTPKQRELNKLLGSKARDVLLYGGARSGKTFLKCRGVAVRGIKAEGSRHLIVRRFGVEVKRAVWNDTWPKMMKLAFPGVRYDTNSSSGFVKFSNGSEVWFSGLDDKERVEKILGNEYATIYYNECSEIPYDTVTTVETRLAQKVFSQIGDQIAQLPLKQYFDLNPSGKRHWTHKRFVQQVDPITGLPRKKGESVWGTINPKDNKENLASEYLDILEGLPERKRKRYFEGEYQDDLPDALWRMEFFEKHRVTETPDLETVVVAVDPSGAGEEEDASDEIGIVVAGKGVDGRCYVLEDATVHDGPAGWGARAIRAYHEHKADRIIAETNFGGAMVKYVIESQDSTVPFKMVTASRGKVVRAEPVSALYEKGMVSHVGIFSDLEDQMVTMTPSGYKGDGSPDRLDACVWAVTELMMLGNNFEWYVGR